MRGLSWCDIIFEGVVEGVTLSLSDRGDECQRYCKKCDVIFEWHLIGAITGFSCGGRWGHVPKAHGVKRRVGDRDHAA